jgi:UDP-glucose 6-dehydrogenase
MAIDTFQAATGFPIEYHGEWEAALHHADLAVIQTDWPEIRDIQAEDFKRLLRNPIVVDGRRTFEPTELIAQGIRYYGIGWKNQPL